MIISRSGPNEFHLKVSEQELATLKNCLNEVINGIHVRKFQTRIGVEEEHAKKLLRQMGAALHAAE